MTRRSPYFKRLVPWSLAALSLAALLAAAGPAYADEPAAPATPAQLAQHAREQQRAWTALGKLPNLWEGTWQGEEQKDDFTGAMYTDAAKEYIRNFKQHDDSQNANCKTPGMPRVMYNTAFPIKFTYVPGMIAIYLEGFSQTRFIYTDGRTHDERLNPTFLGTSVGHWEGDTLVVDTRGIVMDTDITIAPLPIRRRNIEAPHGPNLRIIERMHLKDFNTLEIQQTIEDDTIYTRPMTFKPHTWHRYLGRRNEPQEWVCSDNREFFDEKTGETQLSIPAAPASK